MFLVSMFSSLRSLFQHSGGEMALRLECVLVGARIQSQEIGPYV